MKEKTIKTIFYIPWLENTDIQHTKKLNWNLTLGHIISVKIQFDYYLRPQYYNDNKGLRKQITITNEK